MTTLKAVVWFVCYDVQYIKCSLGGKDILKWRLLISIFKSRHVLVLSSSPSYSDLLFF